MSKVLRFTGGEDFYSGRSIYQSPKEANLFLSLGNHVDLYFPPSKRSRISAPFVFSEDLFEQKRQDTIEVLPDECLFEIFRRLPGGQERSACACVSKRWLNLLSNICPNERSSGKSQNNLDPTCGGEEVSSEDDGFLSRSLEGKKATDIRLAAIAVGTADRGGLGKLSIRGSKLSHVTSLGLGAIARSCPSLKALSLWHLPSVGDEGLLEVANGCHQLEKLDLCQCPNITNKFLVAVARNCPNLTDISIESCSSIGNEGLAAVGQFCQNLKSISIKNCPSVGDQGIVGLISRAGSAVTKLKLQALNITDVSLAVIGHYATAVTDLTLASLHNVTERGFWVMGNGHGLQRLRSLIVTACRGATDLGLESLGKGCPSLKQLCIRSSAFLSDGGLVSFMKSARSLESLQLEECHRITLSGLYGLVIGCGDKLKSLALTNCWGFKRSCSPPRSSRLFSFGQLAETISHSLSLSLSMKRKKWSELEERTLLAKYSELASAGALAKLKTREKKFKPIAEHVNAAHHLRDPARFPFRWSWRDVSIKVQNMRHQYLGVKQKIRAPSGEFNWDDGQDHWENFLTYKEVFGDVELEIKGKKPDGVDFLGDSGFGGSGDLGLGFDLEDDDDDDDDDDDGDEEGEEDMEGEGEGAEAAAAAANSDYENADDDDVSGNDIECDNVDIGQLNNTGEGRNGRENGGSGVVKSKKFKRGPALGSNKKWRVLGAQVIDLRDAIVRREERRGEREFYREKSLIDKAESKRELEFMKGMRQRERMERLENRELELDKREVIWARREIGRRMRLEREFDEERWQRRRMEEKREEEEMEWRERMIELQIEHEKVIMQMQADACQNQMQILGIMARMVCQFFGSASDALSGGLGGLPPQVLQNLQHPSGLDDSAKPETNSPSEFM